jgi:hypothetical protein
MSIPIEPATVGISALSGGAVIAFIMKIAPILLRKWNGSSKNNDNSKPGKSDICFKRGIKMGEHEVVIKQLCKNMEDYKETHETARKENREDHKQIFAKLDDLK